MKQCSQCKLEIPEGEETVIHTKNKKIPTVTLCRSCKSKIDETFKAETTDVNLPMAAVAGGMGAILAALIWYGFVVVTNRQIGLISVIIGWLIAKAVIIGAGNKRGAKLQVMSAVATFLSLALSEYLIFRHFLKPLLEAEGYIVPLLISPGVMVSMVIDSLAADSLTLIFWKISLWIAFKVPAARSIG